MRIWSLSTGLALEKGRFMQRNLGIPEGHHIRKKVRGPERRLRSFARKLDSILGSIPDAALPHDKSWHYHLPSPHKLIDSTSSSFKLRKRFLQLLAEKLVELDSNTKGAYATLLCISVPFLSKSRIEICLDNRHFDTLRTKSGAPEWRRIGAERNIIADCNISLPKEYHVIGYSRGSADAKNAIEEDWMIWKDRARDV